MRETLITDNVERLRTFKLFVTDWAKRGGNDLMGGAAANRPGREGHKKSAEEILGMPNVSLKDVEQIMADVFEEEKEATESEIDSLDPTPSSVYDTVEASVKYKSYVVRQEKDIESWRKAQGAKIPPTIIYDHAIMPTFSKEEIEKLNRFRPSTFAEASQISGLTPQSIVYLYHHVMRLNKESRQKSREAEAAR